MDTMNIALSSEMKDFVRVEVSTGGYSSTSEYIRDLIRREQKRRAEAELERLLVDGLDSGPSKELTAADWKRLRERIRKRRSAAQKKS